MGDRSQRKMIRRKQMEGSMAAQDLRAKCRNCCETAIVYADYNTNSVYDAKMYNYSSDGIYFISDYPVEQGTGVTIKIVNGLPCSSDFMVHDTYHAEVMWCREIDDATCYGVGAKYCDNYRQFQIIDR
jgi:hypothetical protein